MKILFEDNENSPVSKLLKACYNGNNIRFSNGVGAIINKMDELLLSDDFVLIFVDVPVNNAEAVGVYNDILNLADKEINDGKVMVIPIICIEYIVLKMLINNGYISSDKCSKLHKIYISNLIETFDYKSVINIPQIAKIKSNINRKDKKALTALDSLEILFKLVLNSYPNKCFHNCFEYTTNNNSLKVINENSNNGRFYIQSCTSECKGDKYCKLPVKESLKIKAEQLYTSLPVFEIIDDDKYSKYLSDTELNSYSKINFDKFYNDLYEHFSNICFELETDMIRIKRANCSEDVSSRLFTH